MHAPSILVSDAAETSLEPIFIRHNQHGFQQLWGRNHVGTCHCSTGSPGGEDIYLLLFPYAPCHPQLQLLAVSTGEEQSHVPLNDEPVMTVPNFPMTVPDAPGDTLPAELPTIGSHFEAVTEIFGLIVVAHEP